ncbi:hypothetical protein EDD28_0049 [Salana multivorans]|uniref:Uncharacterized protein n=1 Tax=Salana multivorans TaxID=120377 RepID=A0A3N2D6T6_9MICO|nr:hypothetical protein [Salana multivorans]ROR95496.1 hypothetical protein EDD28_0049 [Salana multivorans]
MTRAGIGDRRPGRERFAREVQLTVQAFVAGALLAIYLLILWALFAALDRLIG